jgi:CheY-like chemotaxis protein
MISVPQTKTILVVDDDPADRTLVSQMLFDHGYVVIQACDGLEALEIYKKDPSHFDLLVTDILMPGIDGVELVQRVRRISPRMKVLFVSGYQGFDRKVYGQKVQVVNKTYDMSRLAEEVAKTLNSESFISRWIKGRFQRATKVPTTI